MARVDESEGKGARRERRGWRGVQALVAAAALLAALAGGLARAQGADERIHLVLLHTNDLHGQVLPRRTARAVEGGGDGGTGGLARIAAYVARVRAEHRGPGRGVLLVDGGDWFQGTPEGALEGGARFVEALVELGYDAMAVGNHEWDLGEDALAKLIARAKPPAVCANVRESPAGARVFEPWRVVECAGVRVAFVGLVAEETPWITHRDARRRHFASPVEELARARAELPRGVDLVVPLTHCGIEVDRALAVANPDLALIVGGHSHTFLRTPDRVGRTHVVQAGSRAMVVGRVDLVLDARTKQVLEVGGRLVDLGDPPQSRASSASAPELVRLLDALVRDASVHMDDRVGELVEAPRAAGALSSSGLGNWITDCLREALDADVGIHNKGGIRANLAPGAVTRRHLFEVAPFGNTAVVVELTGAELEAVLRASIEGEGRRGVEFSGMTLVLGGERGKPRLAGVEVGGAPLEPERRYRIATNSFLGAGGDRLFEIGREIEIRDSGRLVRDLLEEDLRGRGRLTCPAEDRYHRRRDRAAGAGEPGAR